MNPLLFFPAAALSIYALYRLARVVERMEAISVANAARPPEELPDYGVAAFAKDLVRAVILTALFIGCLVLAFGA
jgi:multisubunit Na+/H+ antiporter MnhC subunit